ncbi:PEP/pyruvate-binding domain-containing protein [Mycobacterium malmoense]|uniref:PEP/pyruvate-binding domain-containing protein n=1 Tax=Mycobacterium malmoense TaxID=1780 RepID=UPI0009F2FCF8
MTTSTYLRFFEESGSDDVALVGARNASLGETFQKLSARGVRVPHGFAVTAQAYRYTLDKAAARDRPHAELAELDPADVTAPACKAKRARQIVYGAGLPGDLAASILDGYRVVP